jgi:glucose-6-phosphate isomerase
MDFERMKRYGVYDARLGFGLDVSGMPFEEGYLNGMKPRMEQAFEAMAQLEAGAVANPDEGRMVGHYWLRTPELAPGGLAAEIAKVREDIRSFCEEVIHGDIRAGDDEPFENFILAGIGGSALGPQLTADALGHSARGLKPYFFDNTDPDGMDRTLETVGDGLARTLVLVISKSGGTIETRNGMLEIQRAMEQRGVDWPRQFVAVTQAGSGLDRQAADQGWLHRFPMWDWVGGRYSVTSAVGLLPASLQGIDADAFLEGAAQMDALTRVRRIEPNPAAVLSLMWYWAAGGEGKRDMVLLPYRDQLSLFAKYLQQLVMESLGKDRGEGQVPRYQGIAVYGNKGSTDQHAYVQQLLEGVPNAFVTFIETRRDARPEPAPIQGRITSGDYLRAFLYGTRQALTQRGRPNMTVTVDVLDARTLGALIALYERAVGFYASLTGINAYHQPGVESGKKSAARVVEIQEALMGYFDSLEAGAAAVTAEQAARALGLEPELDVVWNTLENLSLNHRGIRRTPGDKPWENRYGITQPMAR